MAHRLACNTVVRGKDVEKVRLLILTENYHNRLKEQTAKGLIEWIALNMNAKSAFIGRNARYQTILYGSVQALANFFVIGKNKGLDFNVPSLAVSRNDNITIQK